MSSKYVPPSMRNKAEQPEPEKKQKHYRKRNNYSKPQWELEKEAAEKAEQDKRDADEKAALENTEENFPSLSSAAPKQISWGGRKFSELAAEWKEKVDEDAISKNVTDKNTPLDGVVLPKFNNVHRFHEPEEKTAEHSSEDKTSGDEWKTVRRKVYTPKKKTVEDEIKEEEEKPESDDTVWETEEKEEHETCWDERRY